MARSKGSANLAASLEVLAGAPLDARLVVDNLTDLITASVFPYSYVGMPVAVKSEEAIYMLTATPTTNIDNWKLIGGEGTPETYWGYLYNNKFWEESTHTTEITAATDTLYITKDTDSFYKYTGTDYVKIGGGDAIVYQPGGSYLFANIPALSAATLGFVYDVQDAFTTTSDFLEGAGNEYPAGTDVSVVNVGTTANPVYKYNIFIGTLSGYQKKIQYTALPTANADELGNIYQYVGTTTSSLTNGCWYKCVSDGESTPTYSWEMVATQEVDRVIAKADFDLLPTAQKNNGLTYYIPDASVVQNFTVMGNRFDKANIYTADERMVGSWMGKPLYQIAVDCSSISSGGTINAGLTNVDKCVYIGGIGIRNSDGLSKNMPPSNGAALNYNADFFYVVSTDTINYVPSGGISGVFNQIYAVLRYTKTSDGTISIGTENDYSTDEMIIGTWIDSKPLYQKTVQCTSPTTAGSDTIICSLDSSCVIRNFWGLLGNDYPIVPINYYGGGSWHIETRADNYYQLRSVAAGYLNYQMLITIQYTKSTD